MLSQVLISEVPVQVWLTEDGGSCSLKNLSLFICFVKVAYCTYLKFFIGIVIGNVWNDGSHLLAFLGTGP